MRPSWGERLAARTLRFIPVWLALEPERVLINAACVVIGVLALVRQPRPDSVLAAWPEFLRVEWGLGMAVGGFLVVYGFVRKRRVGRVGLLAVALCSLSFVVSSWLDFGLDKFLVGVIFLFVALAKLLRLLVSSGVRAHMLTRPPLDPPPPGRHERPEGHDLA